MECGIAYGLGLDRLCLFWMTQDPGRLKNSKASKRQEEDGTVTDKDGRSIEDFNRPLNLMFSEFTVFEGTMEEALKGVREIFNKELVAAGYEPFAVKE